MGEGDSAPVTCVVADDHPMVRDALVSLVGAIDGFEVVAAVGSSSECVAASRRFAPDLVLLDLSLPEASNRPEVPLTGEDPRRALSTVEQLRALDRPPEVVALSGNADVALIADLLDAGCRGFAHKLTPAADLSDLLRDAAALAGEDPTHKVYDVRTARALVQFLRRRERLSTELGLTATELDALRLLQHGSSTEGLMEALHLSRSSVGRVLRSAYAKLDASSRAEAVAKAISAGLLR